MRIIAFLILWALCTPGILAREIMVASASEINRGEWIAGDTLVFRNGLYVDIQISLKGIGSSSAPIVLRSETPGKVIFTGTSRLDMGGDYLSVEGFHFKDGYSKAGTAVVTFKNSYSEARFSSLRNCQIESYNPSDLSMDYKWVSLYGRNNIIEACSFTDKRNAGTLLVIWLDGKPNHHVIRNNYFGERISRLDENGKEINGQEIIRVGDSNTSLTYSNTLVENNLFQNCDGEIEIISNKSCGNIYRNNLFLECAGSLTLRHGNDCIVDGNYFIGNKKAQTAGVRIIGQKHKVFNNYFENLAGTGYRSALSSVLGIPDSPLAGYLQVEEALVVCNTFIDCKSAIELNYGNGEQVLPMLNSTIALNVIQSNNSSNNICKVSKSTEGLTCRLNLYNQGSVSALADGFIKNNNLGLAIDADGIYIPEDISVIYRTTSSMYNEVKCDLKGGDRIGYCCAGAVQNPTASRRIKPSLQNTGVLWLRDNVTFLEEAKEKTVPRLVVLSGKAIKVVSPENQKEPLLISVFDIRGSLLGHRQIGDGFRIISLEQYMRPHGIYLVTLQNQRQQVLDQIKLTY